MDDNSIAELFRSLAARSAAGARTTQSLGRGGSAAQINPGGLTPFQLNELAWANRGRDPNNLLSSAEGTERAKEFIRGLSSGVLPNDEEDFVRRFGGAPRY